jgi:RNA polymerase sigma-70 factor (ECF subfamily)
VNEYERRKPTSSLDALDEESGYEPAQDSNEEAVSATHDIQQLLARLGKENEAYRSVLVMRYIDELDVNEIAEILGEAENTISVRIHRALSKMCAMLEEENDSSYDTDQ